MQRMRGGRLPRSQTMKRLLDSDAGAVLFAALVTLAYVLIAHNVFGAWR